MVSSSDGSWGRASYWRYLRGFPSRRRRGLGLLLGAAFGSDLASGLGAGDEAGMVGNCDLPSIVIARRGLPVGHARTLEGRLCLGLGLAGFVELGQQLRLDRLDVCFIFIRRSGGV